MPITKEAAPKKKISKELSELIALGKEKGSGKPNTDKIGTLTRAQAKEIAEKKMVDLNAHDLEQAIKTVAGSARSMGVDVK